MESGKTKKYGLGWIFGYIKGTRLYLALFAVIILIATGLEMSFAFFLKEFVDIALGESTSSLPGVALFAVAVMAGVGLMYMLGAVVSKFIYGRTERKLRTTLLETIFTRRMRDISKEHTGDLLTKLTLDAQAVSDIFPSITRNIIGSIASILIAVISMFILEWRIALIVVCLTPVLMFAMSILTPFIEKASARDKENDEENRSMMQEYLSRIMLVKTYFMQAKTTSKVRDNYTKKLRSGMKLGMWEGLTMFTGMLVGFSMFIIILGVGAYFVIRGETNFGNLVAIVQLLNYVVNPVARVAETISLVSQAKASAARIGTIIELPADTELTKTPSISANELIAEDIHFSYDSEDEEAGTVLKNIHVKFDKGMVSGIVGKSGSGKSTLLKLLIGLYQPSAGSVSLNHLHGTLNGEEIMPQVAYVPPVDYLFSGSVAENIIMSDTEPCIETMEKAANDANILDFIRSLPQGFDTVIGESGGTVSSGQAQRIAIARAIYKGSPVLVFDEPTANLDADSIEKFQSAIKQISKEKICIVVTHDTSTMDACDTVLELEGGRVSKE
ncbi:MAG: ABC transporter ATP-binding protein/permease [Oscillospiraceae bacterium]|nr:ABC transporter ATP-binding protein/permease [Oscillospiraceae bacterium]